MTIELDGSYLEGGGQILRTAVGLSTLTGKGCRINNIRAGRSDPGLRHQHMKSIEACGAICSAEMEGLYTGSTQILFSPGTLAPRNLEIDIGTAGSISLLLQALLIPVCRAGRPVSIRLKGGTHVLWSPSIDYIRHIFCRYMESMGISIDVSIARHGFYPKGGGEVDVTVYPPGRILPLELERRAGTPEIDAWSLATENLEPARVAERQLEGAEEILHIDNGRSVYTSTFSSGTALLLAAGFDNCVLGASRLGRRGTPAETVGAEAARSLEKLLATTATVDEHLADQLLPFLSMAGGTSTIRAPYVTGHVRTNIWVIRKFLDVEFNIEKKEEGAVLVCQPDS